MKYSALLAHLMYSSLCKSKVRPSLIRKPQLLVHPTLKAFTEGGAPLRFSGLLPPSFTFNLASLLKRQKTDTFNFPARRAYVGGNPSLSNSATLSSINSTDHRRRNLLLGLFLSFGPTHRTSFPRLHFSIRFPRFQSHPHRLPILSFQASHSFLPTQ
jgi:hypothetical protein